MRLPVSAKSPDLNNCAFRPWGL